MIVVDTTILLYTVGGSHPLRAPSGRLVAAIGRGAVRATTTIEVIQEFVHVYGRRRDRREASELGRDWAALLAPLISTTRDDLEDGLALYETHSELGAFDSLLAAAALTHESEAIASADRAFSVVPGLRHLDPTTRSLDDFLSS